MTIPNKTVAHSLADVIGPNLKDYPPQVTQEARQSFTLSTHGLRQAGCQMVCASLEAAPHATPALLRQLCCLHRRGHQLCLLGCCEELLTRHLAKNEHILRVQSMFVSKMWNRNINEAAFESIP